MYPVFRPNWPWGTSCLGITSQCLGGGFSESPGALWWAGQGEWGEVIWEGFVCFWTSARTSWQSLDLSLKEYMVCLRCTDKHSTTSSLRIRALIYSICWFLRCKYSHHNWFQWIQSRRDACNQLLQHTTSLPPLLQDGEAQGLLSRVAQPHRQFLLRSLLHCHSNLLCLDRLTVWSLIAYLIV